MDWQSTLVLAPLAFGAFFASAQSSVEAPLPDVPALVQQAIQRQQFAESREQGYVFRLDVNDISLKKECTWAPKCPTPGGVPGVKGVAFQVIHSSERHFEIFWRDGVRVAVVLPPCGSCDPVPRQNWMQNAPVSGNELAVEDRVVESQIAAAKAAHARGQEVDSPDDPPQLHLSKLLELCSFSSPRRQTVESRASIQLDFACNLSGTPRNADEALLKSFSGTAWLDEEDRAIQRVEGRFDADVNAEGRNVMVRKGTRVTITNTRVDAGLWLLSSFDARGEGRYFGFTIDGDGHIFAGNYQKLADMSETLSGQRAAETVWAHWEARAHTDDAREQAELLASQTAAQEAQAREYWTDPSTGLMWTAKDNGKDLNWRKAVDYCRDLRLDGYSDWRLANLSELQGIYDRTAEVPGLAGMHSEDPATWHVKGNLFLTAYEWSSNYIQDDRGHFSGYVSYFDFNEGKSNDDPTGWPYGYEFRRALCVRGSGDPLGGQHKH